MTGPFLTEALGDGHRLTSFDCGKPELDLWLRESARHAQAHRTSRTFVWHAGAELVVAYFSLAAHLLAREILPKSLGHGAPAQIPAVLLARLALDKTLHGRGLGGVLLVDALARALAAGTHVGVRFVVTDAIFIYVGGERIDDAAASFYQAHGFRPIPTDPHRLVRKASSIADDLAKANINN